MYVSRIKPGHIWLEQNLENPEINSYMYQQLIFGTDASVEMILLKIILGK